MIFTTYDVPHDLYDIGGQRNVAQSLRVYDPYNLYLISIIKRDRGGRGRVRAIGERPKGRTSRTQVVRKQHSPQYGSNVSEGSHFISDVNSQEGGR